MSKHNPHTLGRTTPVYRRDDVNSRDLHFVGWATPKQSLAEVAGRHLPLKVDFWRRAVRGNGCLIVEYYKPTPDEQLEWEQRQKGLPEEEEIKAKLPSIVSARDLKALDGSNGARIWARVKHRLRPRIQPSIAHREPHYAS